MYPRFKLLAAALALMAHASTSAVAIADLDADFTANTFPPGWQYLRNTGEIDVAPAYAPLLWDTANGRYDVTASGFPAPGEDFTAIALDYKHPGPGTVQGAAFDRYLVAAYTIQSGEQGSISLVNGSLAGIDPGGANGASNGWEVRTFVGSAQVGSSLLLPWSSSAASFSASLGNLAIGDTIYVALGPNGSHLFDAAAFNFQLTTTPVPEPNGAALLALGLAALGFWVQQRRSRLPPQVGRSQAT